MNKELVYMQRILAIVEEMRSDNDLAWSANERILAFVASFASDPTADDTFVPETPIDVSQPALKANPIEYLKPPMDTVWVDELPDPINDSTSGVFVHCPTCYALGIYKEVKRNGYAQHMRIKHGIRKKSN